MTTLEAIVIAVISAGGGVLIKARFDRRKTNGDASKSFAEAAKLSADQSSGLLITVNDLRSELAQTRQELLVVPILRTELAQTRVELALLREENAKLRLALCVELKK